MADLSDEPCAECPNVGLTRREVPAPGGTEMKVICPKCGTIHEKKDGGIAADKA